MCDNHTHDGHTHCHCNSAHKHQSPEETVALLSYMSDHNKHHAEDLHEVFHALEHEGKTKAAELLHEAMHLFSQANALLDEALAELKKA